MTRKFFRYLTVVAFMMSFVSSTADAKAHRAAKAHRIAIQVDQNDPAVMNLALNNATNVVEYYRARGENVEEYHRNIHSIQIINESRASVCSAMPSIKTSAVRT